MSIPYEQLFGNGNVPLWYSGMEVQRWQTVRSPADGELYTCTAATGAGATDPADDTTNYVAISYRRTLSIANVSPRSSLNASTLFASNIPKTSPPSIGAGVRTLIFSASGRGVLGFFGFVAEGTATWRVEIIIDGRTVHDNSLSIGTGNIYMPVGRTVFTKTAASVEATDGTAFADAYSPEFRRSVAVYVTPATARTGAEKFAYLVQSEG